MAGEDRARRPRARRRRGEARRVQGARARLPGPEPGRGRVRGSRRAGDEEGKAARSPATWISTPGRQGTTSCPRSRPSGCARWSRASCWPLELEGTVDIEETADEIRATVNGPELGLLIGRHGSTIDALQDVASRAAYAQAPDDRKRVVVDAAGYRERREAALQRAGRPRCGRRARLRPGGRARADEPARAEGRPHLPGRARRRGDALRGRRARSPPGRHAGRGALGRNT